MAREKVARFEQRSPVCVTMFPVFPSHYVHSSNQLFLNATFLRNPYVIRRIHAGIHRCDDGHNVAGIPRGWIPGVPSRHFSDSCGRRLLNRTAHHRGRPRPCCERSKENAKYGVWLVFGVSLAAPSNHESEVDATEKPQTVTVNPIDRSPFLHTDKNDPKSLEIGDVFHNILGDSNTVHASNSTVVQSEKIRILNDVLDGSLWLYRRQQRIGCSRLVVSQSSVITDSPKEHVHVDPVDG
mmetsp:Transcript_19214/g.33847  ORF Transcript_19214/g.33847 Transcript_19214/m.33847 type:complete len:239 (-) Transcript_19214:10-726(-)